MRIDIYMSNNDRCLDSLTFVNALIGQNIFTTEELEEIAMYLLVYSKHNKESEE